MNKQSGGCVPFWAVSFSIVVFLFLTKSITAEDANVESMKKNGGDSQSEDDQQVVVVVNVGQSDNGNFTLDLESILKQAKEAVASSNSNNINNNILSFSSSTSKTTINQPHHPISGTRINQYDSQPILLLPTSSLDRADKKTHRHRQQQPDLKRDGSVEKDFDGQSVILNSWRSVDLNLRGRLGGMHFSEDGKRLYVVDCAFDACLVKSDKEGSFCSSVNVLDVVRGDGEHNEEMDDKRRIVDLVSNAGRGISKNEDGIFAGGTRNHHKKSVFNATTFGINKQEVKEGECVDGLSGALIHVPDGSDEAEGQWLYTYSDDVGGTYDSIVERIGGTEHVVLDVVSLSNSQEESQNIRSIPTDRIPKTAYGLAFTPKDFGTYEDGSLLFSSESNIYLISMAKRWKLHVTEKIQFFASLDKYGIDSVSAIQFFKYTKPSDSAETPALILTDWTNLRIIILELDPVTGYAIDQETGRPLLGTTDPVIHIFHDSSSDQSVTLGQEPLGIAIDPVTNDVFVSTYGGYNDFEEDRIYHFIRA